jgi:DNA-binding PadR family transcriptional regulator
MFRFLVLGLLRHGAQLHGYALVKAYRERSGAEVSTGNFYRELQRLVLDGLIRAAANPPDADARRTPYEITPLGIEVFDEWFTAREAAGGAFSEDDISARALFVADAEPATVCNLFERLEENLWFSGKAVERARRQALTEPSDPARFDVLSLLLARRLKRVAADLEFLEEFRAAYAQWLGHTHRSTPELIARARDSRRELSFGAPRLPSNRSTVTA